MLQRKNAMNTKSNGLCLLLTLGLASGALTGITGCSQQNNPNPPPDRTAGQVVDDKTLTASVKSALAQNPDYKFPDITVDTMNGTVQLSGFVNTADQKSKAVEVAKGVQGVKDVDDKMTVKPAQ
jgi:hyperosmotically inducible periplasmic protein